MKVSKMNKVLKSFILIVMSLFTLVGCGNQRISDSKPVDKTTKSAPTTKKNKSKKNVKSSTKQASTLWNDSKDKQLESFIGQWAQTMKQSYIKYNGTDAIETSVGTTYPDDLSKVSVEGTSDSIGWSKTGKGNYSYNVVAIYNYDGTKPPLPNHITYFFAFHNGEPVALVDQSRDGTPNLLETKNTKLKEGFNAIADGNYKASSSTSSDNSATSANNSSSKETVTDPKMIGVMVRELAMPGGDVSQENQLGIYTYNGKYWIGTGTSTSNVGYTIDGNTIHYFTKDVEHAESTATAKLIEHTISLDDLISKYYSTPEQKQLVQDTANKMPDIENE